MSNDFREKLKQIGQQKDEVKKKGTTAEEVAAPMDEPMDFEAIAAELEQLTEEPESLNSGHVKTTLYIEEPIFRAFQALTRGRGEKKAGANEALADWVAKEYNRRKSGR